MNRLMYSCEQAAKLSSLAMEKPLQPAERLLLKAHLLMCNGCTNFSRQIEFLRIASNRFPEFLEGDGD